MVATASDLTAGIAPGSLEHGERAPLEAGLMSGAVGGASQGAAPSAPPPPVDAVGNPLAALINGDINPGGQPDPLTAGLSVGPGPGPAGTDPLEPKKVRLRQIATQGDSPLLRAAARNELRRMVRAAV